MIQVPPAQMNMRTLPQLATSTFVHCLEVLPPRQPDPSRIVERLQTLPPGAVHFLNIADSPMARPRMNPTVLASVLSAQTGLDTIVHLTVRDRNRIALASDTLGARAVGIPPHLAGSGDPGKSSDPASARPAGDMSVLDLIRLCVDMGQIVGAVFDPTPDARANELRKLEHKVAAGARFIITQPTFSADTMADVRTLTEPYPVPVIVGILPLYSAAHADYLHNNVPGISIPQTIRQRMASAQDAVHEGISIARELLSEARSAGFQGICLMPPFGHYELAGPILGQAAPPPENDKKAT